MSLMPDLNVRNELEQQTQSRWDRREPVFKVVLLTVALVVIAVAFRRGVIGDPDHAVLFVAHPGLRLLMLVSSLVFLFSLLFRTVLWFRYRPCIAVPAGAWPEITVVVPAYNEGAAIADTLRSLTTSNYPNGKLRVIAVDDGSVDETFTRMEEVQRFFPQQLELIRLPCNCGKRAALYQGFLRVRSPVVVTVDSDTRLAPAALREIVRPLLADPRAGAVTGRVQVWNQGAGPLTKMVKANFAMAFDFSRAVQSTFASVFCASGAFTAYRTSALQAVVERWLRQRFLGRLCTFGEDRSLTNHLLRAGWHTLYQRHAVACTIVPETVGKLLKMFTRWARSNLRESIVFASFFLNPAWRGRRLLAGIEFFSTVSLLLLHLVWFYIFLFSGLFSWNFGLRMLSFSILFGFFYMLYYMRIEGRRDAVYILVFSLFSSFFMVFIFTWAGLTIAQRDWATR